MFLVRKLELFDSKLSNKKQRDKINLEMHGTPCISVDKS